MNINGTSGFVMHIPSADNANGFRNRAIGTGQEVSTLLATADSLGYAFWSTANFQNVTTTNSKYLTVDGVDPLLDSYATANGDIPTVNVTNIHCGAGTNLLSCVTFSHLQDGTYPIWSLLRLVTEGANPQLVSVQKLAGIAQGFVTKTTRPDFIPFNNNASGIGNLKVFHSHFPPPTVDFASSLGINIPADGTGAYIPAATHCSAPEAGGDVGGVSGGVTTVLGSFSQSDDAYCQSTGNTAGQTGHRK